MKHIIIITILVTIAYLGGYWSADQYWKNERMFDIWTSGAEEMKTFMRQFPECAPHVPEVKTIDLDKKE